MEWCCTKQIKLLYNNIEYCDYFEPINRFSKENNNIFEKIIKKKIIDDTVIQYYIKSRDDISIIILYPSTINKNKQINTVIEKLKEKGDIHYIKDIKLTYLMAYNLIFQLYASEKRMKSNTDIMYKINRLGFINDGIKRKIKIIVYTLKDKTKPINGKSALFKMELRDFFVQEDIKTTTFSPDDDNYPRGYDYIHVSDDINQSFEYAGIFFHRNTIKFLKKQKSYALLEMYKTKKHIDKIKNFFYDYSQNELEKLLIFSSGVLYSYGIREANDLDCILLENNIIKPHNIDELNNQDLDISYKGTKDYNIAWEKELNNRAILFGAEKYQDLIINPKYYYYFMGIKFLKLKYDIKLRLKRGRPAQITDLLIIRQMYNLKYKLEIPKTTTTYDEINSKDVIKDVNKKVYLETIKFYLQSRYYINLNIEQIEKWIYNNFKKEMIGGVKYNNLIKYENENDSNKKYVYPSELELLKINYIPKVIIYSSNKPYLYPGESFKLNSVQKFCKENKNTIIKLKNNNLRIASFNLHNFISRCNQGIAPLFNIGINPFENARDINKFIDLFKLVNADIICLQELVPIIKEYINKDITDYNYIRNNFNFDYLNKLMKDIGYEYSVIGTTQHGKFYTGENKDYYYLANGIYSKIKIEESEVLNFSYLNRNIIRCKIIFNNKIINILNTHFEYFEAYNPILKSNNQISQQFIDLENYINSLENDNIIICGDFNINLFNKNNNNSKSSIVRYKNWEEKTKFIKTNFINSNQTKIPTNFSQDEQTDFIIYHKNFKLKCIYSFTVFTIISDHYLIFSDYI